MKKTLVCLILCGLMLATILPTSALGILGKSDSNTSGVGRSTIRGFAVYLGPDSTGKHMRLFAIRLHFITVALSGERSSGVIYFKPIDIPAKIIGFHGRLYFYASFFGTFDV